MTEPCGVEIISFTDMGTAVKSGLVDGDVIIGADGESVDAVASLLHVLGDKKVGDNVTIQTMNGNYTLTLIDHPQKHIPILGIQGQEKKCSKYF
jgi:PDZ domain-containing secreted protein